MHLLLINVEKCTNFMGKRVAQTSTYFLPGLRQPLYRYGEVCAKAHIQYDIEIARYVPIEVAVRQEK